MKHFTIIIIVNECGCEKHKQISVKVVAMDDICRLCLSVCPQMAHKLSNDSEILVKLQSCLSLQLSNQLHFPRQVCQDCIDKINEIYEFKQKVALNDTKLCYYLNNGIEILNDFYVNLKSNLKSDNGFQNRNGQTDFHSIVTVDVKKVKEENDYDHISYSSDDDVILSSLKKTKESTNKKNGMANNKKRESCHFSIDNKTKNNVASEYEDKVNKVQIKTESDKIFKCLTCFSILESQNALLGHYKNDHSKKKTSIDRSYSPVISHDGSVAYKCNKCDKVYENARMVNRHVIVHMEERPYLCNMCGRSYRTVSEIIRHGRVHSGYKMSCSYHCGYSTVYMGALKEHERRHTTEFKYTCGRCGRGFQVRTWYEQHQNVHNGVKPFVCDICGVAFHMDRYLTSHRNTVHPQATNHKRYVCEHCSLTCDSRRSLAIHLKEHGVHTGLLCDICGKTLSNQHSLKFHKRTHLGVKPFVCSICNKSFTKKFNLKLHERTHTGVKAHGCTRCGKFYAQRSTLIRHTKRHHSTMPHKCPNCQKTFPTQKQCKSHERKCMIND